MHGSSTTRTRGYGPGHKPTRCGGAIVILGVFSSARALLYCYQLLEIPSSIFDSVQGLLAADFRSDAPVLDCSIAGEVVVQVAVARSDDRITIRNICAGACVMHTEWHCWEPSK